MSRLVPDFILENYRDRRLEGSFEAFTLFVDISGFTDMTRELMVHGKEGAEVLAGIINAVFTPSIRAVYNSGGFIASFAGDAFTAVFEDAGAEYALRAVFETAGVFRDLGSMDTRFGRFSLSARMGLSFGRVEFSILETGDRNVYYFRGPAVDGCAESEARAGKGQAIADRAFAEKADIKFSRDGAGHFLLKEEQVKIKGKCRQEMPGEEGCFVPETVLGLKERGEFREIVSCFINFSEKGDYRRGIKRVTETCSIYGGYLNRIGFGDKGGTVLVLFGAPEGREKLYERACDFALSLKDIDGFAYRAGIAGGIAFAGFAGSDTRSEYTVLGNVVNLSSRIMSRAEWGTAVTDRKVKEQEEQNYEFEHIGYRFFKGLKEKTALYLLKGRYSKRRMIYPGRFIGRKGETQRLRELVENILKGRFGGIVYIEGEAGIGKSRFIDNFSSDIKGCSFFYMPCDEILRKSFNPFISFFSEYFGKNQDSFASRYAYMEDRIKNQDIKSELLRTESIIRALTGLGQEGSFLELEAERRYKNTLYAVKNFIKALSIIRPAVLVLDDAHWIDSDSIELIKVLVRNVKHYPFIIMALCRPGDDGAPFNLDTGDAEIETARLRLEAFSRGDLAELAESMLETGKVPGDTLDFIYERSEGNPFFAEQIVLYLIEQGLLDSSLRITEKGEDVPSGISQIITARIDRLSAEMREAVKAASVLGREFALRVLEKLLVRADITKDEKGSDEHVDRGCKEQIWESIAELKYIFRHALIRDTAYELQLKESLRRLHGLAGEIIEQLYRDSIREHLEDLAEHYDRSANREKAVQYLRKAGDKAESEYHNQKALDYYTRLVKYLYDAGDSEEALKIQLMRGRILQNTGRWDEALKIYWECLKSSELTGNIRLRAESAGSAGYLLKETGRLDEAMEYLSLSVRLSQEAGYSNGISRGLIQIGSIYSRLGDFDRAMGHFDRAVMICKETGNRESISVAAGEAGIIYSYRGDYIKALESFEKMLSISEELGSKGRIICALGNIGGIYYLQDECGKALENFEKSLEISIQIGDKAGISYAYGNMGIVYRKLGDSGRAMEYYKKMLEISEEIGQKSGISLSLGNMVNIYINDGRYEEAMDCCMKNLALCRKIGDKIGLVHALRRAGSISRDQGQYEKAEEYYKQALDACRETGVQAEKGDVYGQMEILYFYTGEYSRALECCDRSLEILRPLKTYEYLSPVLFDKALILARMDNKDKALELAGDLENFADQAGSAELKVQCRVLGCIIDRDEKGLADMLKEQPSSKILYGFISYELWRLNKSDAYRQKALKAYRELYMEKPLYEYRVKIRELEG